MGHHEHKADSRGPLEPFAISEPQDPLVVKAIHFMKANLQGQLTRDEIACHVGSSVRQMSRRFRESMGTTPAKALKGIRMSRGAELLRDTDLSPKEIAVFVGVHWIGSLGRVFRETYGISPAMYRVAARRASRDEMAPAVERDRRQA